MMTGRLNVLAAAGAKLASGRTSPAMAVLLASLLLVGCESKPQGETVLMGPLILSEMPDGEPASPTDIKDLAGEKTETVLAGRIDAGDLDPFQPGEVAFIVSQLPDEGHGADDPDHADNCPFCKHKLESAPKAIVQFRGPDGKVLAGDAREALALQKGDIVYVAGAAQYNPAVNTVMVDATGVFRQSKR